MTCPHCSNAGIVSIWSGLAVKQFKEGDLRQVRTIAVACSCGAGEKYLKACRRWRFDERKMFLWNGDTPEQRELLREFLERRRVESQVAAKFDPDAWVR